MDQHLGSIVQLSSSPAPIQWTPDQTALLKRTICRGATDDELSLFLHFCKRSELDPFSHQVHYIKRWNSKDNREVGTIQVAIDGYRLIAERSGRYEGQTKPEWCGKDGVWTEVWLEETNPHAARIGVYKRGAREATYGISYYDEKVQKKRDGTPTEFWCGKKGVHQLAKCAEAEALRKAFPQELGGTYTDDEMGQADTPESVEAQRKNATVEDFLTDLSDGLKERIRKSGIDTLAKAKQLALKADLDSTKLEVLLNEMEAR